MRKLERSEIESISGGYDETFVFEGTGSFAGGSFDGFGDFTDEYGGTWDRDADEYIYDAGDSFDVYGGYYDIYGGYYDAYGGYVDAYGGYYDTYGGYYDIYGGYYDDLGGYYDYYGGYYDAYGGYYDYNGGYYDYYGGYTDGYGGYWDTGGGYSDGSGGFYDGYGNYWDSGNNWYDYYGSTGNCYPAAPPVAGPEPEPIPPEEPDLITPPELPDTDPESEAIDAGEIEYGFFNVNYDIENNDLPNAACGLTGKALALNIVQNPGTFGLDSVPYQAAWATIGHMYFLGDTGILAEVAGWTNFYFLDDEYGGANFRGFAMQNNLTGDVEVYVNGIRSLTNSSDLDALRAMNDANGSSPTIDDALVLASQVHTQYSVNSSTDIRISGYSEGGGLGSIIGAQLNVAGNDVISISTFGAVNSNGYFAQHYGSPTLTINNYTAPDDPVGIWNSMPLFNTGRPGTNIATPNNTELGVPWGTSHDPQRYMETWVKNNCSSLPSGTHGDLRGQVAQWVEATYGTDHPQVTVTVTNIPA